MIPQDAGLPEPTRQLPAVARETLPLAGRPADPVTSARPTPAAATMPPALTAGPDLGSLIIALRQRWIAAVMLGGPLAVVTAIGMWFVLAPKPMAMAMIRVEANQQKLLDGPQTQNDFRTFLTTTAAKVASLPTIDAALKKPEVRELKFVKTEIDPAQAIQKDLKVEFKDNIELVTVQYTNRDARAAEVIAKALAEAYVEDVVKKESDAKLKAVTDLQGAYLSATTTLKNRKVAVRGNVAGLDGIDPATWKERRSETTTALREARKQHSDIGLKLLEARSNLETYDLRVQSAEAVVKNQNTYSEAVRAYQIERDLQKYEQDVKLYNSINKPAEVQAEEAKESVADLMDADPEVREIRTRKRKLQDVLDQYEERGVSSRDLAVISVRDRIRKAERDIAARQKEIADRVSRTTVAKKSSPSGIVLPAPVKPVPPPPSPKQIMMDSPEIMRAQLTRQISGLQELLKSLDKDIVAYSTEISKVPSQLADYEQALQEVAQQEKIVEQFNTQWERAKVAVNDSQRVSSYQGATLIKPDNKKQILGAGVAPLAVFAAVCGALAFVEFRKRRVLKASQVSSGLGLRVVGAIPKTTRLDQQLLNPAADGGLDGTPVMESIDAIRTRLLHDADTRSTRVVLVTSANEGEGKTTLAGALALSLARAGRKTLLIDGDVRKPALHDLFELPLQPGLSEVLVGELEPTEAARETHLENLSLMAAGQWDREVLVALSRDGVETIFEKLEDEFDFIIVDTHPLMAATDALLLGRQADAAVLSVLREVSLLPRVFAAGQMLQSVGVRVLGAVVSAADPEEVYMTPGAAVAG